MSMKTTLLMASWLLLITTATGCSKQNRSSQDEAQPAATDPSVAGDRDQDPAERTSPANGGSNSTIENQGEANHEAAVWTWTFTGQARSLPPINYYRVCNESKDTTYYCGLKEEDPALGNPAEMEGCRLYRPEHPETVADVSLGVAIACSDVESPL